MFSCFSVVKGFASTTLTDNDPVTRGWDQPFRDRIPGAKGQPHTTIRGGGHFLQEGRGEEFAKIIANFVKST